uniref:Uncharacterized protein n=1 Tax=Setaria viridis TaxID=4556 RepID=A0A4U6TQX6_SETVI|nr:hypothetical protein SEVIR_7G067050v2 [Setaria viridis]
MIRGVAVHFHFGLKRSAIPNALRGSPCTESAAVVPCSLRSPVPPPPAGLPFCILLPARRRVNPPIRLSLRSPASTHASLSRRSSPSEGHHPPGNHCAGMAPTSAARSQPILLASLAPRTPLRPRPARRNA